MKKSYKEPKSRVFRLYVEAPFLEASNISIGGSTDHFDSNERENPSEWDECSQDEE